MMPRETREVGSNDFFSKVSTRSSPPTLKCEREVSCWKWKPSSTSLGQKLMCKVSRHEKLWGQASSEIERDAKFVPCSSS